MFKSLVRYFRHKIIRVRQHVREEMKDFRDWTRDPINRSAVVKQDPEAHPADPAGVETGSTAPRLRPAMAFPLAQRDRQHTTDSTLHSQDKAVITHVPNPAFQS